MELNALLVELKRVPLTAGFGKQIELLHSRYKNEYIQEAENILHLFEVLNLDAVKISRMYIYDYLKQMSYFLENMEYGHTDFNEVKEAVYDNERLMTDIYLPGLLLSYAYTTILYEKNHLFLTEFLPKLDETMSGIEIGFGEGYYIWRLFQALHSVKIYGYDISPHAIQFTARLLQESGVSMENYSLRYGNIFEGIPQPAEAFDFGVLAEVIEHIPNPQIGIREITRMLKRGGFLYLTTVINSNHMDHISNFESADIVQTMMEQEGLNILAKKMYHMTDDFPESMDISVGLAFVAVKP